MDKYFTTTNNNDILNSAIISTTTNTNTGNICVNINTKSRMTFCCKIISLKVYFDVFCLHVCGKAGHLIISPGKSGQKRFLSKWVYSLNDFLLNVACLIWVYLCS